MGLKSNFKKRNFVTNLNFYSMKKWLILCLVLFTITINSCSDSNEEAVVVTLEKLMKKWYNKDFNINGTTFSYDSHMTCGKDNIEFRPEAVYTQNDVTACEPTETITVTGTWNLEDDIVTVFINNITTVAKITRLTETELQLTTVSDWDGDGQIETIRANFTID